MSKQPTIFIGLNRQNVVTKHHNGELLHDHTKDGWRNDGEIDCANDECRRQLLLMGGVEMVKRTWYVARDRFAFSIPQSIGGAHQHEPGLRKHKGAVCDDPKCEHTITCSSPDCTRFFEEEWRRWWEPFRLGAASYDYPSGFPVPCAAPSEDQRPPTNRHVEEQARVRLLRARETARIKEESERLLRESAFPLPR
jgi:hypothetical protein